MRPGYFSYLDYRVAQRRLAARFARPRGLLLHVLAFVATMTGIWIYGNIWELWFYRDNYTGPVLMGLVWSLLLLVHAVLHVRRSPAMAERRELAVEDEMRQLIEKNGDLLDDDTLFAMHHQLEADLEKRSCWSLALLAFTVLNVVSWAASTIDLGTSWAFQVTLPLAVATVGAVIAYMTWERHRQLGRVGWFARLPLRHLAAYGVGSAGLWLAAAYRLINPWDAETLFTGWSIVLLVRVVWSMVVWPVLQRAVPDRMQTEQSMKRKRSARLALAGDGEMPEMVDGSSVQSQTNAG